MYMYSLNPRPPFTSTIDADLTVSVDAQSMSERSATSLEGHQEDAAVVEPAHDENHQDVESNLLLATLILMDAPESAYPCCVRHQVRMAAKYVPDSADRAGNT